MNHGEVHVWQAMLDRTPHEVQSLAKLLAPAELERAARYHFERDRTRFTVRRALLRLILGEYLKIPPEHLQLVYGAKGKPALSDGTWAPSLHFNLSHSQGLALYAFAWGRDVGVDIEKVRPLENRGLIVNRFFSREEQATLLDLPETQQQIAFFQCWTRKEAYTKALGEGLGGWRVESAGWHAAECGWWLDYDKETNYKGDKQTESRRRSSHLSPAVPRVQFGLKVEMIPLPAGSDDSAPWYMRDLTPVAGYAAALVV